MLSLSVSNHELFPVIFSWRVLFSFPVIFICKSFDFWYSLQIFSIFTWLNVIVIAYSRHLSSPFARFLVDLLFLIKSRESIYDPLRLTFILWLLKYNKHCTKKKFIKDFFSKCDQICSFLQILLQLLKKFLIVSS